MVTTTSLLIAALLTNVPMQSKTTLSTRSIVLIETMKGKAVELANVQGFDLEPLNKITVPENATPVTIKRDRDSITIFPGSKVQYLGDGMNGADDLFFIEQGSLTYRTNTKSAPNDVFRRKVRTRSRSLGTRGTEFTITTNMRYSRDQIGQIMCHVYHKLIVTEPTVGMMNIRQNAPTTYFEKPTTIEFTDVY